MTATKAPPGVVHADFSRNIAVAAIREKSRCSGTRVNGQWVPATIKRYCFIEITMKDSNLSISGVEGPYSNGECWGGCGQCIMSGLKGRWEPLPGVDIDTLERVWNDYHLNHMQAGTPKQTECLKEFFATRKYPDTDYDHQLAFLKARGLEVDDGYKYGTSWLRIDVPKWAAQFLLDLPDPGITNPWARSG